MRPSEHQASPGPGGSGAPAFKVDIARRDDDVRLTLHGEFDLAAEERFTEAMASLGDGVACLTVDLSRLAFIDSTGVRLLLDQRRALADAGSAFRLDLGRDSPAGRVIGMLGLSEDLSVARPPEAGAG
jgi:anti-anti-sigma factor